LIPSPGDPGSRACTHDETVRFPARLLLGVIAAHAVLGVGSAAAAALPQITLSGQPVGLSNAGGLRMHWAANFTPVRAVCTLDEHRVPCDHGLVQSDLTTGKHVVQVTAWRAGGAVAVARAHWWTDLVPPTVPTVSGTPSGWVRSGPVLLIAGGSTDVGSQIVHYEYRFATSPNGTEPGDWQYVSGIDGGSARIADFGTTTVEWRARDGAGNVSAWTAPQVVRIDYIAPTVTAEGPAGWQDGPVTVTASATDVGSGVAGFVYETSTENGVWSQPRPGDSVTVADDGITLVRFAASDAAGNMSAWQTAGTVVGAWIDTTPPTLTTPYGAGRWMHYTSGVVTYASDSGSGVASVEYDTSTDGGETWSDPQPGNEAWVSQEGVTEVRFRATDWAGNVTPWTTPTLLTTAMIDYTPPALQLSSSQTGSTVTVTADVSDAASGIEYVLYDYSDDGGASWAGHFHGTTVQLPAGPNTIVRFEAIDNASNVTPWVTLHL
jgi:hypothetical protein